MSWSVAGLLALGLLVGGCGMMQRIHHAEVLEPASQGGGPESKRWVVLVRLEDTEVLGTDVTYIGFDAHELRCDGGGALDPSDVEPRSTLTFERVGDVVETSSPPVIAGRDLRVNCGTGAAGL